MSERWGWVPSHKVVAPPNLDKIPPFDERSGEHYWLMLVGFLVFPLNWEPDKPPVMDQENLVSIQGPGCYHCEQPYTEHLARRRCKGQP